MPATRLFPADWLDVGSYQDVPLGLLKTGKESEVHLVARPARRRPRSSRRNASRRGTGGRSATTRGTAVPGARVRAARAAPCAGTRATDTSPFTPAGSRTNGTRSSGSPTPASPCPRPSSRPRTATAWRSSGTARAPRRGSPRRTSTRGPRRASGPSSRRRSPGCSRATSCTATSRRSTSSGGAAGPCSSICRRRSTPSRTRPLATCWCAASGASPAAYAATASRRIRGRPSPPSGTPPRASRARFCHPEGVFDLTTPWWEIILRTAVVYVLVLVLLRIAGKRELGQMSPVDLVVILVIANAVQNAMTGGGNTLLGGGFAASPLLAVNLLFDRVGIRLPVLQNLFPSEPPPLPQNGKLVGKACHA